MPMGHSFYVNGNMKPYGQLHSVFHTKSQGLYNLKALLIDRFNRVRCLTAAVTRSQLTIRHSGETCKDPFSLDQLGRDPLDMLAVL